MNPLIPRPSQRAFSLATPGLAAPALVASVLVTPVFVTLAALAPLGLARPVQASSLPTQSCAYDPTSGRPNPMGGKAFISINEIEGDTIFTYQELPKVVQPGNKEISVNQQREMTLASTSIEQARKLLVENPKFYNQLLGYESSTGFGPVNNSLTCWLNERGRATGQLPARVANFSTTPRPGNVAAPVLADPRPAVVKPAIGGTAQSATPAPPPTARPTAQPTTQPTVTTQPAIGEAKPAIGGAKPATQAPSTASTPPTTPKPATQTAIAVPRSNPIGNLPDGNYRVWNGQATSPDVSDETLLQQGGALFIFKKEGNKITGNFAYIDGEDSACVFGFINNDTVSGFAYPYDNQVRQVGDEFINLGPADFLQVRRSSTEGKVNFYRSALLNLKAFNPISLGPVTPPTSCQS